MRVLHIFSNPSLTHGASIFEYRISGFLKEKDIFFDYLVTQEPAEDDLKRYSEMGSKVYQLPIDQKHGLLLREFKINREYYRFFKEHPYAIVYADTENSLRAIHLWMARLAGVPVRVVHSHNTNLQTTSKVSKALSRILRNIFRISATHYFACSDLAAKWLFPKRIYGEKNYVLVKNGIDLEKFEFNPETRNDIRTKLQLSDEFVIGNVGRFVAQKNHVFIVEVFHEFLRLYPNSKLLLIGDGPLKSKVERKADELKLTDRVILISKVENVHEYYQAMDFFLMPSLFEGLPITGIEAQAAGVPCLFSDTITKELKVTELAHYQSLKISANEWASYIYEFLGSPRKTVSGDIRTKGYSILDTVEFLTKFYESFRGKA